MKGQWRLKRTEMGHSALNWNTTLFFCLYSETRRKSNIPSLIGIKLLVGVGFLCELFKISSTTHWRDQFQLLVQAFSNCNGEATTGKFILYDFAQCKAKCGFRNAGNFCLWNPESGILDFGICDSTLGVRNPAYSRNPESKFHQQVIPKAVPGWNLVPQRKIQNPGLPWITSQGAN